ncbi:PRC-barrel domain-containing protein [Salinarimonas sp.]|uniref:PRC-barrel domain-containing protein n=1 Tax=Salinarimonas sp. TaxID=2766526 RepID=UPI0032D94E92
MKRHSFTTACALSALLLAGPALAQSGTSGASDQPSSATETMQVMPPAPEGSTTGQAQTGEPAGEPQPIQAETDTTSEPVEVQVETVEADTQPMGGDVELQGGFIARQGQNHLMASELMDAEVRTAGDEDLGSVEDMLVTADGRILGVVVGVGGFLGIGEKRVAIPSEAIEVIFEGEAEATEEAGATQPPAAQTGRGLAMTGGTDIRHILVDYTREELQQAPDFARLDQQGRAEGQAETEAEVETPTQPVEATGATPPPAEDDTAPAQPQ